MPRDLIAAVARRTSVLHGITAVSWAAVVVALLLMVLSLAGASAVARLVAVTIAGAVAVTVVWRRAAPARGSRAAAAAIERVRPSANVVITAEELRREPSRASSWMTARINDAAARSLAELDAAHVAPSRGSVAVAIAALAATVLAGMVVATEEQARDTIRRAVASTMDLPVLQGDLPTIAVVVSPPAYTRQADSRVVDPERLEALEGSRIRFELRDTARCRVRFGQDDVDAPFVARDSGYFAIEEEGTARPSKLIPLTVTRDRLPRVRIEVPARDLLLPDAGRPIRVSVTAADDFAVEQMELRYTKVSGAGERFAFEEGSVRIQPHEATPREWRGAAELPLDRMRLGAGDSLVYRAVARDRRPGESGLGSSDTYFVEIAGPGQVPLEGMEMPPQMERYAMSQQMIVLKIERLRAREGTLARETLAEESASIAAEQRTVRANFIFLLGGHVEDEEEEAERSHEIQEGRLENTARREINAAISHMTRAEQGLVAVDTAAALPSARLAVEALQRAFGRSRYLLRSLASRSRLDLSRRESGDVRNANDWRRASPPAEPRPGAEARALLDGIIRFAAAMPDDRRRTSLGTLAESALAIEPASGVWQEVSRRLLAIRDASPAERSRALEEVIAIVSEAAQAGTVPRTPLSSPLSPVRRGWLMEQRR